MRYAGIMYNDIADGNNICVSFWTQGCPHRCTGCHNPETWSFDGGYEDTVENLIDKIRAKETIMKYSVSIPYYEWIRYQKAVVKEKAEIYPRIKLGKYEEIPVMECTYDELGYKEFNN